MRYEKKFAKTMLIRIAVMLAVNIGVSWLTWSQYGWKTAIIVYVVIGWLSDIKVNLAVLKHENEKVSKP